MENINKPKLRKEIRAEVRDEVSSKEDRVREYIERFILNEEGEIYSKIKSENFKLDRSSPEALRQDLDSKINKALKNLYEIPSTVMEKVIQYIEKDLHTGLDTFVKGASEIEKLLTILESSHGNSNVVKFGKLLGIGVLGPTLILSMVIPVVLLSIFPIKIAALISTLYLSSILGRKLKQVFSKFMREIETFARNINV